METAVAVQDLIKIYPRRCQPAVDGLCFAVAQGEVFGLLGPNGAGKSTTIRIIAGLITPTSGTARVFGYDSQRQGRAVRQKIGLAGESERAFYHRLTGWDNLVFFGGLAGLRGQSLKNRIERVLELLELEDVRGLQFMKYSTGMKKRLAIARACLCDPALYMVDEPTSGVDPVSAIKIRALIKELAAAGRTVLLATHNLAEAELLCDRVAIMRRGRAAGLDSPAALRAQFGNGLRTIAIEFRSPEPALQPRCAEAMQALFDALSRLADVSGLTQKNGRMSLQVPADRDLSPVLRELADAGLPVHKLEVEGSSLEEVFVRLTQGEGQ